jgi:hypothetical protein
MNTVFQSQPVSPDSTTCMKTQSNPQAEQGSRLPLARLSARGSLASALIAFALAAMCAPAIAAPQPPEIMTYQGFLVDANGNPLAPSTPVNYPIVFRIFDASQGGNLLWSEQQIVTVDKGQFSVLLGEGTPVPGESKPDLSTAFAGETASDRFIGVTVTVGATTMDIMPRLRLLPSPYAFLANNAVNIVQPNGTPVITYAGGQVQITGNVNAGGFIGEGAGLTSLPATITGNKRFDGNIGIGINPTVPLHLSGSSMVMARVDSSNTSGNWLALGNSSAGGRYWHLISSGSANGEGAGKLLIGSGSAANVSGVRMTLQDNGNVGIGTANPAARLHLSGGGIRLDGNNVLEFGGGVSKEANAGKIGYQTFSSAALDIVGAGTATSARKIKLWAEGGVATSGNLGIRTDNPDFPLSIAGSGTQWIGLKDTGGTTRWHVNNLNSGLNIGQFGVADARLFIAMDGFVGLGTASPVKPLTVRNSHWPQFRVEQAANRMAEFARDPNGVGGGGKLYLGLTESHHTSGFRTASFDGDNNWDFASDRRMKKDIEDAEPMLDRALQVQLRRFRWLENDSNSKLMLGVIAQEVQPLFPDVVSEQEDPTVNEKRLAVGYSDFGLIALKALQELHAIVKKQESQIGALEEKAAKADALEGELAALKQQLAAQAANQARLEALFSTIEERLSPAQGSVAAVIENLAAR